MLWTSYSVRSSAKPTPDDADRKAHSLNGQTDRLGSCLDVRTYIPQAI
jgi:hypothetical protein